MSQYEKQDDFTLKIISKPPFPDVVSTYTYKDLVANRDRIISEKVAFNTQVDQRIAEAQAAIDAADGLGITAKVDVVANEVII